MNADGGYTALMYAAENAWRSEGLAVRELISSGADPGAVNNEGKKAIELADIAGSILGVKILQEHETAHNAHEALVSQA